MRRKDNKNIDDILASLEDDDTPSEGFNRNYFQSSSNPPSKPQQPKYTPVKPQAPQPQKHTYKTKPDNEPKIAQDDDWGDDDKADDFDDDDNDAPSSHQTYINKYSYSSSSYTGPVDIRKIGINTSIKKNQCDVVYLGNFTTDDRPLCENLLCTKCDVKVSIFKNKKWKSEVDYLFFRNNYSRKDKLETMLVDSYGTCCYSCQCTWNNISDDYIIASKVSNWVCLGH